MAECPVDGGPRAACSAQSKQKSSKIESENIIFIFIFELRLVKPGWRRRLQRQCRNTRVASTRTPIRNTYEQQTYVIAVTLNESTSKSISGQFKSLFAQVVCRHFVLYTF